MKTSFPTCWNTQNLLGFGRSSNTKTASLFEVKLSLGVPASGHACKWQQAKFGQLQESQAVRDPALLSYPPSVCFWAVPDHAMPHTSRYRELQHKHLRLDVVGCIDMAEHQFRVNSLAEFQKCRSRRITILQACRQEMPLTGVK